MVNISPRISVFPVPQTGVCYRCEILSYPRQVLLRLLLILLSFFPLGAMAAGISASFQTSGTWNGGYSGALSITNGNAATVSGWTATLQSPNHIDSAWNATLGGGSGGSYTLTPADWTKNIAPGASVSIGFTFSGDSVLAPSALVFNGQSIPISTVTPNPTPTPTPAPSPTPSGSPTPAPSPTPTPATTPTPSPTPIGVPGTPTISVQQNWTIGGFDVMWAVYSGGSATSWKLLEDGIVYYQGTAPAPSNGQQAAKLNISNRSYSAHLYQVIVSNSAGSTSSAKQAYLSDGASKISIGTADSPMQARQVTVGLQQTTSYTIFLVDGTSGNFQLASNNDSAISYAMTNANTFTVTGRAAGRASLRITNTATNESRWLGVRVRNVDGSLPGLPKYVSIGSVSEDSAPYLDYWRGFGSGDTNRRMDMRYIYLNDGPSNLNPNNWYNETSPHGFRVTSYVRESLKLGMIPFFVWYNINGTGDGPDALDADFSNVSFMQGYFTDLKMMLDLTKAEGGDEMVGIVIEPDSLGYLVQLRNVRDPNTYPVRMDAAYTSGVLTHGVDPEFANTVVGYVQAVNYIISKNMPQAVFGWEFALWASPNGGWAIPNYTPGLGLMHQTDSLGVAQGRYNIAQEATAITDFYMRAGVASYGASFVSVDKYGEDAAYQGSANPAATYWFWDQTQWINYLTFVDAMALRSQLPVVLWQIPIGHINSSQSPSPAGGFFPNLANVSGSYEDSAGSFFFGDTFKPGSTTRFNFFSTPDPLANVSTSGDGVTWPSAMSLVANHGVQTVLFGPGVGESTQLVQKFKDAPFDGNWWITQAQRYFQHPVAQAGTTALPGPGPSPTPTPTPTPGPSPTPVPSPTPTPVPGTGPNVTVRNANATINFHVDSDWGSGFQGKFTITNTTSTAINNWKLTFVLPASIGSIWNGNIASHTGSSYVVTPPAWAVNIAAGQSVDFGFVANPGNIQMPPTGIVVSAGGGN